MILGYALHPKDEVESLDSVQSLAGLVGREDVIIWADLESPEEEELHRLGQAFQLDPEALDDCLHGDQRPRIDAFDDYIFIMLYGVLGGNNDGGSAPHKLAVFCSRRFLITVHRRPVQTVRALQERCARQGPRVLGRGIDFVLYSLIDKMVDNYTVLAEGYESQLDDLEEVSLEHHLGETFLMELATLRRKVLELRHLAISQKELLLPIAKGEYEFASEALEPRFSHVHDHLVKVIELTERLRDLINGARDNYHSTLTARTNAVMKVLTVFASVLVPMSVLAGIYGMNVPLWPAQNHPMSFWGILAAMLLIAGAILGYLRWRKWI